MNQFGTNPLKLATRPSFPQDFITYYPYAALRTLFDMANKKQSRKPAFVSNITFINYRMDKPTKDQFNAWFSTKGNTVVDAIFETLQADHKLSISWDPDNEVFIAAMTGKETSLNAGKCLTMRSGEWFKAMAALAYIHTVVYAGEIWDVEQETDMV